MWHSLLWPRSDGRAHQQILQRPCQTRFCTTHHQNSQFAFNNTFNLEWISDGIGTGGAKRCVEILCALHFTCAKASCRNRKRDRRVENFMSAMMTLHYQASATIMQSISNTRIWMMADGTPDLATSDKPRYLTIADAIADDVAAGR